MAPMRLSTHTTQYFEMFVNRGIYHNGWTTVTKHSLPWIAAEMPALDEDVWELYGPDDWTQAHDLAAENPEMLAHLQRLFIIEAGKYNVLPLDDRRYERFNADIAGRPQLIKGNSQLLFGGMGRLSENSVVVLERTSHTPFPQRFWCPKESPTAPSSPQGGASGGLSLYVHRRKTSILPRLLWAPGVLQGPMDRRPFRRGTIRFGSSSPTTGVAWARVET